MAEVHLCKHYGMTYIIGLGGTGSKFVKACVEGGLKFTRGLTVDNVGQEHMPSDASSVDHLRLIEDGDNIEDLIARGISLSMNSESSQEQLRNLASWRPDHAAVNLPLAIGAGRIRSFGRAISIAKREELRTSIIKLLNIYGSTPDILIATSTDGGTGSALLRDVIEICKSVTFENSDIAVLLFDSLVIDEVSAEFSANAFWTLSEAAHLPWDLGSGPKGNLSFHIIQTNGTRQIDDALRMCGTGSHVMATPQHERFYLDNGTLHHQYAQDSTVIESALDRSASRLFYSSQKLKNLESTRSWLWGRTQPLLQALALDPDLVEKIIEGWLSLSSRGLIRFSDGNLYLLDGTTTHQIPLLRPTSDQGVDVLAVALETISLSTRLEKDDPGTYAAINFLIQSAERFKPVPESWSGTTERNEVSARQLGQDLAEYYGRLATSNGTTFSSSPATSDEQISFVQEQFSLAEQFSMEPYDGSEYVLSSGQVTPDTTLFRDISHVYLSKCKKYVETATEIVQNRIRNEVVFEASSSSNREESRRLSRRIYAKPGMTIRFGVPAGLVAISVVGIITFLSSAYYRSIWADTSTAVGGIMGIVAVCLGAVALMWSIQNSSVETARTDRLFTACLGIQEMTLMTRIALQNAIATNNSRESGSELWQHQSLRLAAFMLGKRITEALDSGLFGLLASIDEDNGVGRDLPMSSASRKVFVLLDDLVRVAPEIISEKELEIREKPADPERVLELAEELRRTLEPVTYRFMADTLRRTPASV